MFHIFAPGPLIDDNSDTSDVDSLTDWNNKRADYPTSGHPNPPNTPSLTIQK